MPYGQMDLKGRIDNYKDAEKTYNSIKPIRGRSTDVRPLARRGNDKLTIRKDGDDYIVKMYNTDIVTYHPNGDVSFVPYASVTTGSAVSFYSPEYVSAYYTSKAGMILRVRHPSYEDTRFYDIGNGATLHPDGSMTGTKPMRLLSAAPKAERDRVLQETGFDRFQLWLRTVHRLGSMPSISVGWSQWRDTISATRLIELIKDGTIEGYKQALVDFAVMDDLTNPTNLLAKMRTQIYQHTNCITERIVPYVEGWPQLRAVEQGLRRYG